MVVAATRPRVSLSLVVEAVDAAWVGGGLAVDRLIEVLVMVDEAGDRSVAWEALALVQTAPRVIVRLDERGRRVLWSSASRSPVLDRAALRLDDDRPGPIAVALASTHRDGHVRERAVGRMVERPDPVWMPFLVLRTADWVKPVLDRARAGLALLLAEEPQTLLPAT